MSRQLKLPVLIVPAARPVAAVHRSAALSCQLRALCSDSARACHGACLTA